VQFIVRFYEDVAESKPVLDFLSELKTKEPILHKLLIAGIRKLGDSERHGPPLTALVDRDHDILELRVGSTNIARVFFFFRKGQEIILTNGYVKKQQKVDTTELKKAQGYKKDWEARYS
jgi:phage-related protein